MALGLTNRQIAEQLCVADGTVTTHVKHILRKLNLGRRSQIAAFAVESRALAGATDRANQPGSAFAAGGAQRMRGFGRPPALVVGATAAVLVGLAASMIAVQAPRPAEPRADGTPRVRVPPTSDLIYSAPLDGTSAGLLWEPFHGPDDADTSAVVVRTPPAAIEFEVRGPGGSTGVALDSTPLSRYTAELDLAFAPGSDMTFFWTVRWLAGNRDTNLLRVEIQAASESMELALYQDGRERTPVTRNVVVPRLQSGRPFTVTVVADGDEYQLLLDAAPVAQFTGGRSVRPTRPEFGGFGTAGTVRVLGARVFALESPQANIPPG